MSGHSVVLDAGKAEKLKKITGKPTYKAAVDQIVTRFLGASALREARKRLDGDEK